MQDRIPHPVAARAKALLQRARRPWRKVAGLLDLLRSPELAYLELHLTDHCNLNCRACGHFCPVASPHYAELRQYRLDLQRLRRLFRNIRRIRLMGGEPLLHPEAASFLRATRDHFPRARVSFVTNGILLPQAPPEFWEACRATRTIIGMTVYPPVRGRVAHVRSLCEVRGVELSTTDREIFYAHLNFKGDSRPGPTFARCRARDYCPFLQDGRLYVCATPALVGYFNQRFHSRIAADAGIDIHAPGASGRAILRQLDQPVETCKWCSDDPVSFPWTTSSRRPEEWEAATYRAAGP